MSDKPAKTWLRWIGEAAGALLLLLAAIVVAPLVLTKQLVRIAVMQIFRGNTVSVGEAALSLSGALTRVEGSTRSDLPYVSIIYGTSH